MSSNKVYWPFVPVLKWFMNRIGEKNPDQAWFKLAVVPEQAAGYVEKAFAEAQRAAASGEIPVGLTEKRLKEATLAFNCSSGARYMRWTPVEEAVVSAGATLDYGVMTGSAGHVFLPDAAFADWLAGCVDPARLEPGMFDALVSALPKEPADPGYGWYKDYYGELGVIHIPGCAPFAFGRSAAAAGVSMNLSMSMGEPARGQVPYKYTVTAVSARPSAKDLADLRRLQWPEWHLRLLAGLSLYMDCFPEQIKPGVPNQGSTGGTGNMEGFDAGRSLTLGVSPKVRASASGASGGGHASPTGHYRSGAFMRLTSPRYVKMRGQTIFRHGCFVNGKALTVDGV